MGGHTTFPSQENSPGKVTSRHEWFRLLTFPQDCLIQRHWRCESCKHLTSKHPKQTPPSLSQPPQVLAGYCGGCSLQNWKPGTWLQRDYRPFWKVTHFPSSDSITKPKRSGVTIWNYCLWWNGTVKQCHLFAPAKLKGKITAFSHNRTPVTESLKNTARFYCLPKYLQWYNKPQELLL